MTRPVLDASALLALMRNEPGGEQVREAVGDAAISTVNLAEVMAKLVERGMEPEAARISIEVFAFAVVPFDRDQAYASGELHLVTRRHGLSLADRACLAVARHEGSEAWTTDRAWADVADPGCSVRLLR